MKKYEGVLGKFQYDETKFEISYTEEKTEFLKYIGEEIDGRKIKIPDGVTSLDYTFEGTAITSSPDMPDSVVSADYVCYNCADLESSGKLSKNLKSVESAWGECHALKRAPYLTDSIEKADFAFDGCENMTELYNLPKSLKHADGMFANCKKLEAIPDFPAGLESADAIALNNISLTKTPAVNEKCRNLTCGFSGCINVEERGYVPESLKQEEVFSDYIDFSSEFDDDFEDLKETEKSSSMRLNTKAFVKSHGEIYKASAEPKVYDGSEFNIVPDEQKTDDLGIGK